MTDEPLPPFFPGYHLLSPAQLQSLPRRSITPDEAYTLMCSPWWTGLDHYPDGVTLLPGELGYDRQSRYILIKESP
jgi:hypothetical protein